VFFGTDPDIVELAQRQCGDLNGDGWIDTDDLVMLAGQWMTSPANPGGLCLCPDLNVDGTVNLLDYNVIADEWLAQGQQEFRGNQLNADYDPPETLANGQTYYWRVDEINSSGRYKGDLWQFEVIPNITLVGTDSSTKDGWRTFTVSKQYDVDGDNIYGSDGWIWLNYNNPDPWVQGSYDPAWAEKELPSYITDVVVNTFYGAWNGCDFGVINDPRAMPYNRYISSIYLAEDGGQGFVTITRDNSPGFHLTVFSGADEAVTGQIQNIIVSDGSGSAAVNHVWDPGQCQYFVFNIPAGSSDITVQIAAAPGAPAALCGLAFDGNVLATAPTIVEQPTVDIVAQDAVFTVFAVNPVTGDVSGLRYNWYKYVAGDDDILLASRVENDSWTLSDAQMSDLGQYYCSVEIISNGNTTETDFVELGPDSAVDLYVATNGNDNNSGLSIDQPLATLTAARDKIRYMNPLTIGGVNVWIRGGRYRMTSTFSLSLTDSGSGIQPIAYRAYQDEEVRITGGDKLDPGWFSVLTDPAILDILPAGAAGNVYVCDLSSRGISVAQLFVNDEQRIWARWPNVGEGPNNNGYTVVEQPIDGDTFQYRSADASHVESWNPADRTPIIFHHFLYNYARGNASIASIDAGSDYINLTSAPTGGIRDNSEWYVYGIPEELDSPGEWYYGWDSDDTLFYQKLLYWPDETLSTAYRKLLYR